MDGGVSGEHDYPPRQAVLVVSPLLPPRFIEVEAELRGGGRPPFPDTIDEPKLSFAFEHLYRPYENDRCNALGAALIAFGRGAPRQIRPQASDVFGLPTLTANATAHHLDTGAARWCALNEIDLRF